MVALVRRVAPRETLAVVGVLRVQRRACGVLRAEAAGLALARLAVPLTEGDVTEGLALFHGHLGVVGQKGGARHAVAAEAAAFASTP